MPDYCINTQLLFFASSSVPDEERSATLVLNFGEDVILKRAVTKQLLITNQTAIPATFTLAAEYFACHPPKPNNLSEKR